MPSIVNLVKSPWPGRSQALEGVCVGGGPITVVLLNECGVQMLSKQLHLYP